MPDNLIDKAINAALNSDWKSAISINKEIIEDDPTNIPSLNRLGYAYLNIGKPKESKKIFQKVLKIDPSNPIAQKNLKRTQQDGNGLKNLSLPTGIISPKVFLEEPGITKTVNLVNLAKKDVISGLHCGEQTLIVERKNRLEIRSKNNIYLGALPDDMSFKIRKLLKLGNTYTTHIKSITDSQLTVIIRETKRSKKVKDASFNSKQQADYHASIRSEILEGLLEEDAPVEGTLGVKDELTDDSEDLEEE